ATRAPPGCSGRRVVTLAGADGQAPDREAGPTGKLRRPMLNAPPTNAGAHMQFARIALPGATIFAASASATPVKSGITTSLTGPEAPIGEDLSNGIKLAIEDL